MSNGSLRLIDTISDHCNYPDRNHNMARTLARKVRQYWAVDTHHRSEVGKEDIGIFLEVSQGNALILAGGVLITEAMVPTSVSATNTSLTD